MIDEDDVWCRTSGGIPGGAATDQERQVDEAADYLRRLPVDVSGDSEEHAYGFKFQCGVGVGHLPKGLLLQHMQHEFQEDLERC